MASLTNLLRELVEEILSRIPLTSSRKMRYTCRKWNDLSKDAFFTEKHLAKVQAALAREGDILAVVLQNCTVRLMSVNLSDSDVSDHPSIKPRANLISLNDIDKLEVFQLYHCEGLLLCTTEDYDRLVLWNPFTGQTRWIPVEFGFQEDVGTLFDAEQLPKHCYAHALGYEEGKSGSSRRFKILRFCHLTEEYVYEMYDVNSNSWRVLDVSRDWDFQPDHYGQTVKGNTYWCAEDKEGQRRCFLLCFDFTTERYAPRLPLPFEAYSLGTDVMTLSSVGEEQLAVLYQRFDAPELEVWVTTNIDPTAASWTKLLAVDMKPFTGIWYRFYSGGSFLIDVKKKTVIVFDESRDGAYRNTAYFIGENGYYKEVDLGEYDKSRRVREVSAHAVSYVPSPVQINQAE